MILNPHPFDRSRNGKTSVPDRNLRLSEIDAFRTAAIEEDEQALLLLRQYGPTLIARRHLLDRDQVLKKIDQAIYNAYCGNGGIRFQAQLLLSYTADLLPEVSSTEELFTGGYNSIIRLMEGRLTALEDTLFWLHKELTADIPPLDDETLLKTLGHRDLTPQLKELRQLTAASSDRNDLDRARSAAEHLYSLAAQNLSLARQVETRCELPQKPSYALRYMPLLSSIRTVVSGAAERYLDTPTGWNPQAYKDALVTYAQQVHSDLLLPYSEL